MSKPLQQEVLAEARPTASRPSAPEGGLAWDSLFLWLLSWVALLLGAEWLEADARSIARRPHGFEDEAAPAEAEHGRVRLTLPDGPPPANAAASGWPAPTGTRALGDLGLAPPPGSAEGPL